MARLLAIDWDAHEARYVVAHGRGAKLAVEAAGALPLPEGVDGVAARGALGDALRQALSGKAARATTIAAVGRSQIEVATLSVPPVAEADLPELVGNQAMRNNAAIGEESVIDFVPHGEPSAESQQVTAAAIDRTRLEQVQEILEKAGVGAKAITVRPYGTAALVLESLGENDSPCLVLNVLAEEVDLIVLSGGQVVFWRTVRHANVSRDENAARRLLAEIQRTRVVAQSHTAGKAIEAAYLCGGLDEHPALTKALEDGFPLPVTLVDPFAAHGGATDTPEHPGRYSALVGMLLVEADSKPQAIDFLHPRKRPAPPDRRRTLVLAGAAAALVVLLGGYRVWSTFAAADSEIEALEARLDDLDDQFKRAGQRQKVIAAIDAWNAGDVNWLDELRDLSLRFPSGRDAVVLRMGLSQDEQGGAIDMTGIVRDPVVVSHFENNLRDDHHQISSRHMQQRLEDNNYTWHFESSILVSPREADQYVSHLPAHVAQESTPAPRENPTPPRSAANQR